MGFAKSIKKDGILVFSFLEFREPAHWPVFQATVDSQLNSTLPHLNVFIEKSVIEVWANKLGYNIVEIIDGTDARFNGKALGQSIAILRK